MRNDITISITIKYAPLSHLIGGNQKISEQSLDSDHKWLEAVFLIAICHLSGNKLQSKTNSTTFVQLSIVLTFLIAAHPGVFIDILKM